MEIKGIVHTHSCYSYDAKLTLSELRTLCRSRGLQFACMTEHTDELTKERAAEFVSECDRLSDDEFRFIPGFEVPYGRAHILMIGMRAWYGVYAQTIEALQRWTSEALFVVLAHPVRNHFCVSNELLHEIDALEVWNQQYEGKRVPRIQSLRLFESLRKTKPTLVATGGIDFHRAEHFGAPLVTLDVDSLTEANIIQKLQTGAFTVSSDRALIYGSLPDTHERIRMYRWESHFSVVTILMGKLVNKILATFGLSFPASLKHLIRRKI